MIELWTLVHLFYSDACCAGMHCHPVPCAEITALPDGWQWRDMHFQRTMLRQAPDGQCHVCVVAGPVCIYLPSQS